jgi:hypothetical protein
MKTFIPGPLSDRGRNLLRRAGYGEAPGFRGEISYTRRVRGSDFPRYHAYIEERDGGVQVNLHLDQKAASYQGSHAHSGEYEGPLIEQEMRRIVAFVHSLKPTHASAKAPAPPKTHGGFWSSLFG